MSFLPRQFISILFFLGLFVSFGATEVAKKPVIGILSTPSDLQDLYAPEEFSYIKGSYAEFIEAADGIPVAIPWDLPERELVSILDSINGVLFTGGDASLWEYDMETNDMEFSNFTQRAIFVLRYAIHLNDKGIHFPVYGICQGHEIIAMGIAGNPHVIDHYRHPGQLDTVELTEFGKRSRQWSNMPDHVADFIHKRRSMFYNHRYGFNMSLLVENSVLHDFFEITAKGRDDNGKEFIAGLEAKNYPIYTVQYHPERVLSEWNNKTQFHHPPEAVESIIVQASLFVNEARKNNQRFENEENLGRILLKNHEGVYLNVTWPNTYFYDRKSPIRYHVNPDWSDDGNLDQYDENCGHDDNGNCDFDTIDAMDYDL